MCGSSGRGDRPTDWKGGPKEGNGRRYGRGPKPGSYSPPDPGGRGNGEHEPKRPWWTLDLSPRWARLALGAVIVVFGLVVPTACASDPDGGRDLPGNVDTSIDDRCGETGECEGAPADHPGCDVPGVDVFDLDGRPVCERPEPMDVYIAYIRLACSNRTPGRWDEVDRCAADVQAMTVDERTEFMDRWLWTAEEAPPDV